MKKASIDRNFRKIKNSYSQTEDIVQHSKINSLWEQEASIRKKLKKLESMKDENIRDFKEVYNNYSYLLDYISKKLVKDYNIKHSTNFDFYEIIKGNRKNYLKSGIISVLITRHIPTMIFKEFDRIFPKNPKDEYKEVRHMNRKFYLHLGETNTGKTYNSMERLKESKRGIYLSPLRILALENFEKLNKEGIMCNLITGEEEIKKEKAQHVCCTIEKLDINEEYDVAIIDEIQMIDDDQRGSAWTRAMLALRCKEIHVCGALNTKELITNIIEDCGDEYELKEYFRNIPLKIEEEAFKLKDIKKGDALVTFSKKKVLQLADYYGDLGIKTSVIYGNLPPEVRKKQYEQFMSGDTNILITTDAIGMGVNLPIRRIVFMDIRKFDGNDMRYLNSQEIKQIGGRAGRLGIYDIGYLASYGNTQNFVKEMIEVYDRKIYEAVIEPSEALLDIKSLPLREKLALWSTRKEKSLLYRKMDIGEKILVLDSIKNYKLPEKYQWQLLKVPFDVTNINIMNAFLKYVNEIFIGNFKSISKPRLNSKDLYDLELYYQKLNLYYSLSKNFNLDFDENWVYDERTKLSIEINKVLRKRFSF
ncbi:helicase-related protein [Clostridium botulinum]|uniref:RNA helicase n=2 Tax=Clostridium botulinum TaxID=1491 RepID=A0A846IA81_CLOBO|nr:helicase-related protein [Clostridium botulinum]AJD26839.1 DEAD/DEAH box helicase family protein [Clostridium botulinum CDC_297]ACQ52128.1 helicase domain protein [Clostridium botulinum Ba4 str. 657]AJE12359.1 DEAD/DEAH box helicase family protein [Clostridium botulinum CDC_1436]APQ99751.1 DEAD/DEAH box helicase family protein [Clostridium botulinum]APU60319.1 DEAD/DEAH box helicase family protein [Clostridium botulinum]